MRSAVDPRTTVPIVAVPEAFTQSAAVNVRAPVLYSDAPMQTKLPAVTLPGAATVPDVELSVKVAVACPLTSVNATA